MIPTVTVEQMREVDRLMIAEMGITLLQMMENAGRALATQARRMLGGDARGRNVVVLAGRGGNGGGGLVAARRLSLWGADVAVILGRARDDLGEAPQHQLAILDRIGVAVHGPDAGAELRDAALIIDALIGYSLKGAPREPAASLIRAANASRVPILALDIPSGLNADTGVPYDPAIRAAVTVTLALPKTGVIIPAAHGCVGDLYVADISVPEEVYRRMGMTVGPLFAEADIIRA